MAKTTHFQVGDVGRADFRTSREGDAENGALQAMLGFPFRYQPARLAIGRSLGNPTHPPPAPDLLGKPIRGDTLFGQDEADLALWSSLVLEHSGFEALSRKELQELAGAHWLRGLGMLSADWKRASGKVPVFLGMMMRPDPARGAPPSSVDDARRAAR